VSSGLRVGERNNDRGNAVLLVQALGPDGHNQLVDNTVFQDGSEFAISKLETAIVRIVLDFDTDHDYLQLPNALDECTYVTVTHETRIVQKLCGLA
jgi:hypothetical protein